MARNLDSELIEELYRELVAGINHASRVVAHWEAGDLAGAVNELDGWQDGARELVEGAADALGEDCPPLGVDDDEEE